MSIVADHHGFVIGVDCHAKNHVYSIATARGDILATRQFPTTAAGMGRAISWVGRTTGGDMSALFAIEGTATYGANLSRLAARAGYTRVEAPWTGKSSKGKSDEIDAGKIARATLACQIDQLRDPRADGIRGALAILLASRNQIQTAKTSAKNQLTALTRFHDLGIDVRKTMSMKQIRAIATWQARDTGDIAVFYARREAIDLAQSILQLEKKAATNQAEILALVRQSEAGPLLEEKGYGPISVAQIFVSFSHAGRIETEAKFAALAGVNPVPASSGNTVRHRLNRGGDRQLNSALHTIALTKMRTDEQTKAYVARRRLEGKTDREIRRCLKRYLARHAYRTLNHTPPTQP
ncbi:IS110 family transposase [Ancrocorticia populi]|uniref:IS110 family transposase n=2 Tax=Ancrocorticia populi TaxID=2175228 RepID=A0A2V1K6U5_9ACTO|nr:IS110 family transposase [Ancrocorticia populi]